MNKKTVKIIMCILIFILLMFCFSQVAFADWDPKLNTLSNGTIKKAGGMAIDIFGPIINITQVVGMGIAIFILVVVGIQYIFASPTSKAEIKHKSTNYIIGVVLIFSAAAILEIVKMFVVDNIG